MPEFKVVSVIEAKSLGKALSSEEIYNFVSAVYQKNIDDAQIGAFLMAVKIKGMDARETADLTRAMAEFSEKFDWSKYGWKNKVVDKHSTGGVGDKVSHILAPILAACGYKIPMISGRGLGITGGTIDKLDSIDGFSSEMHIDQLGPMLDHAGLFIIGQTEHMVPVDKCLYAIRDITATIGSVPLITASILCKKKIEDLQLLLMDIKYGKGGFMKTQEEGEILARSMIDTGLSMGMKVICLLDNMDSPLGHCVGNALEIAEVLRALNGEMSPDLKEIVSTMVAQIMKSTNVGISEEEIGRRIEEVISTGKALKHLELMLEGQGVKKSLASDLCKHEKRTMEEYLQILDKKSSLSTTFTVPKDGYIDSIDAELIGNLVRDLKGGRYRKEDRIDYSTGIQLLKKDGSKVKVGDPWVEVYHNAPLTDVMTDMIKSAIKVTQNEPPPKTMIAKILT